MLCYWSFWPYAFSDGTRVACLGSNPSELAFLANIKSRLKCSHKQDFDPDNLVSTMGGMITLIIRPALLQFWFLVYRQKTRLLHSCGNRDKNLHAFTLLQRLNRGVIVYYNHSGTKLIICTLESECILKGALYIFFNKCDVLIHHSDKRQYMSEYSTIIHYNCIWFRKPFCKPYTNQSTLLSL